MNILKKKISWYRNSFGEAELQKIRESISNEHISMGEITEQFENQIAKALKVIVTGEQSFKDAVGGPIIIAKMAGESARLGFQALLIFTAFISLNLGFMNMLPLPVLDGGHLMLLLIEGIRRKPLPVKAVMTIQKVGMAFLLALMIFIIINDFTKL